MLGQQKPAASTITRLYNYTGTTQASVTVNALNQSLDTDDVVQLYIAAGTTPPSTAAAINNAEFDAAVLGPKNAAGYGPLRDDIVLQAGQSVFVRSQNGTTNFIAWGIAEA